MSKLLINLQFTVTLYTLGHIILQNNSATNNGANIIVESELDAKIRKISCRINEIHSQIDFINGNRSDFQLFLTENPAEVLLYSGIVLLSIILICHLIGRLYNSLIRLATNLYPRVYDALMQLDVFLTNLIGEILDKLFELANSMKDCAISVISYVTTSLRSMLVTLTCFLADIFSLILVSGSVLLEKMRSLKVLDYVFSKITKYKSNPECSNNAQEKAEDIPITLLNNIENCEDNIQFVLSESYLNLIRENIPLLSKSIDAQVLDVVRRMCDVNVEGLIGSTIIINSGVFELLCPFGNAGLFPIQPITNYSELDELEELEEVDETGGDITLNYDVYTDPVDMYRKVVEVKEDRHPDLDTIDTSKIVLGSNIDRHPFKFGIDPEMSGSASGNRMGNEANTKSALIHNSPANLNNEGFSNLLNFQAPSRKEMADLGKLGLIMYKFL